MRQAKRDSIDVVLVDTAGRMQDNEPLMHALSMLINKNNPNLVLFVGEALVGNDGANPLCTRSLCSSTGLTAYAVRRYLRTQRTRMQLNRTAYSVPTLTFGKTQQIIPMTPNRPKTHQRYILE